MAITPKPMFLERERELAELDAALSQARSGRGCVLVIEGPAGIGKTELLRAARERAQNAEMRVLAARCGEFEQQLAYDVVTQLYGPVLRIRRERERLLRDAAAHAEPLFGGEPPTEDLADAARMGAILRGLYWLTVNLTERAPLLMAVDDVHWIDAPSARFLSYLAPRAEELPVALLVALRPAEAGANWTPLGPIFAAAGQTVLHPAPLTATAVHELMTRSFGGEAGERFAAACFDASAGNPFLVHELITQVRAESIAPVDANAAQIAQLAPQTVVRAALARLARMSEGTRRLARAVALLGDGVDVRLAAKVAELDMAEAGAAADELARHEILAAGRPLGYVHPLLRAAVREDMSSVERAALHQRAEHALVDDGAQPELIATHALACEPAADMRRVELLSHAARRSLARGAPDAAVTYLRRALSEPPPTGRRTQVVGELTLAEALAGDPAALEHGLELVDSPADFGALAEAVPTILVGLFAIGDTTRGLDFAERAIAAASKLDPELGLRMEAELIAIASSFTPTVRLAEERLERHLPDCLTGDTPARRMLLASLATRQLGAGRGSATEIANLAARALGDGLMLAERSSDSVPYTAAVEVLVYTDRIDLADREIAGALADARRRGSAVGFVFASVARMGAALQRGDLVEAEASARDILNTSRQGGWGAATTNIAAQLSRVLLERGETDQAEEELKQTGFLERIPPEGTEGIRLSWNHALARGRLRLAKGQIREAIDDLLDAIERREAQSSIGAEFTNLRSTAALALAIAGEHEPAAELLAKELADNQHFGTRRAIAITLRAKAQLEHHQRAIELLRESASLLENSPSRLEHARTLIELGAALRRSNRRAEARSPLREGLRLAQQCDANPLAQRALEELEATGERVPRDRRWGPEALTPSERRVAGMAAEGLTNPQIAQALFVTLKTVERHLSNAYLKLNINSRTQLPAALHVRSDTLGSKG